MNSTLIANTICFWLHWHTHATLYRTREVMTKYCDTSEQQYNVVIESPTVSRFGNRHDVYFSRFLVARPRCGMCLASEGPSEGVLPFIGNPGVLVPYRTVPRAWSGTL